MSHRRCPSLEARSRSPLRRRLVHDAAWTCRRSSSPSCRRHRKEQNERKLAFRDVWGDHDVVFDNGIGEPLSPWTVSADFRRAVRELDLPGTRFHDLRHAHATQLLADGVPIKTVSERLGHASTGFTMDTYAAVIPSMGRAAADAAERLFGQR